MIVHPEDARVYNQGLGEARILVDGERSRGRWWVGDFREDPGFMTALHVHQVTDERFFVIEGTLSIFVDGSWFDLEAGGVAEVVHGVPHAQGNSTDRPVRFVGSGNPSGFEEVFPLIDALAKRLQPSAPDWPKEISKIISAHDTRVLGPPPRR